MSIIKMYATALAPILVTSSIDIPAKGVIRTITMGLALEDGAPGATETCTAELSFLSGPTFTTNDARGSLCQVSQNVFFSDAARLALHGPHFCVLTPIAVDVAAGERVYLHILTEGSQIGSCVAYLYIDDGIDVARAQTRRR